MNDVRKELKKKENRRSTFSGVYIRKGIRKGFDKTFDTILLKDIRSIDGTFLANHLWFDHNKEFQKLNLKEGDIVQFDGYVKSYVKGYLGINEDVARPLKPLQIDYNIEYTSNVRMINKAS